MENGATTSPLLSVSDKAEGIPNLQSTESFPSSVVMAHQYHQHRPLVLSSEDDYDGRGGGGGGGGGPNQNDSGANEVTRALIRNRSTTSDDDVVAARSSTNGSGSGTSASTATQTVRTLLQPFDISITNAHKTAFKSPGWGMAAALEFPFTAAQWKELGRQAMIYKYMIASVPVPPHLLLPIPTRTLTTADATLPWNDNGSLVYNLRYTTSSCTNKDVEPGRCKRTDGKKWRCSRDVAPHQKYCERHMHRGRPRSRKPVELHSPVDNTTTTAAAAANNNSKKSRLHTTPTKPASATANVESNKYSSSKQYLRTSICGDHQPKETLFLDAPSSGQRNNFASPTYKEPNRVFGWSAEAEVVSGNAVEQQWLHLMDTKSGLCANHDSIVYDANACIIQQDYGEEPVNLFSYTSTDFVPGNIHNHSHDQYQLFQNNSDLISSKQPQLDHLPNPTRGFIDAWSNGDLKTIQESSSVPSSKENLLPSDSLTLSMALDEEMGLATPESNQQHKTKHFPVSWLPLHSGGPLAEVLRPNNSGPTGSNPASPYTSNGDSISPAATSVSSPTGILHRALFSHSDSSVCNSPTLGASAAPPEVVAFQWLH